MGYRKFSDRNNLNPKKLLQLDSVPQSLRNRLWNGLRLTVFKKKPNDGYSGTRDLNVIWIASEVFKENIDNLPRSRSGQIGWLSERMTAKSTPWFTIYDVVEMAISTNPDHVLYSELNRVLEEEGSGYRFINGVLCPITNPGEIEEIQIALDNSEYKGLDGARKHLETALSLLSDKQNPDYRNSVKESISVIESLLFVLGGKGNFNKALSAVNSKLGLHSQFIQGIKNFFEFTSDEDGIRHAILDKDKVDFDDAKFMFVTCSALFNFIVSKANNKGIFN